MKLRIIPFLLSAILFVSCTTLTSMKADTKLLKGIRITLDPGHGDTESYDQFRVGPSGEREEWINLRVAKYLKKKLVRAGADVQMTRSKDKDVSLGGRASLAKRFGSDLLVSIHHNGSGNDPDMDLPIVYFFGPASQNPASVDFAQILISEMRKSLTFEQSEAGAVYSDHLIYSSGTSILRNTIKVMPGVIGEGGFFTNTAGESRLKSKAYNKLEAEVYFQAILKYVDRGLPTSTPILPDSLEYVDLSQKLQFQLDDGFGGAFFDEASFAVFQDGEPLAAEWNSMKGILSVQPREVETNEVVFQVFGRNFKGNAIHPTPHAFKTKYGQVWYAETKWWRAYEKADSLYQTLHFDLSPDETLFRVKEALHLYRLSLELQIVHPKAQMAETRILELLEMEQELAKLEDATEVDQQRTRLKEYYPNSFSKEINSFKSE